MLTVNAIHVGPKDVDHHRYVLNQKHHTTKVMVLLHVCVPEVFKHFLKLLRVKYQQIFITIILQCGEEILPLLLVLHQ